MKLGDILNSISYSKNDLSQDEEFEKNYIPYVINEIMSRHVDCIMYVDSIGRYPELSKKAQYLYYLHGLSPRKRFEKFDKPPKDPRIESVKRFFNISDIKAEEAMRILTEKQIQEIDLRVQGSGIRKDK